MSGVDRPTLAGNEPGMSNCMWSATAGPEPSGIALHGDEACDVLIIGGGFNGVTAGLACAERGARTLLVEAQRIGSGASGRNAGQVNAGLFMGPDEIRRRMTAEFDVVRFLNELGNAPNLVRGLIAKHKIDCFLDDRPVIRNATTTAKTREFEAQAAAWQSMGANVQMLYGSELQSLTGSPRYEAALIDHRSFTIQPLAYLRGLARAAISAGLRIATNSRVTALMPDDGGWKAAVGSASISARKVILSTNAYSDELVPGFKEEIMPLGAFGYATRDPLPTEWRRRVLPGSGAMWDTHKIPLWFRYDPEGRLHIGSIGFLPMRAEADRWVRRALNYAYPFAPSFEWGYRWSGVIGQTVDQLPHLVEPRPGIFATIGCNGRGIAPNAYFGQLLAQLALGEDIKPPMPRRKSTAYPNRRLALEAYDIGTRLYRNTFLFR